MNTRILFSLLAGLLLPLSLLADPGPALTVREIRYDAALSDNEARFNVDLDLEAVGKEESTLPLFDGEVAVLTTKLPSYLRLVREGNQYRILASRAGRYRFKLDLVAKIARQEPWNSVKFTGPEAAIGSVAAQANGAGVEVQLLTGTLQESVTKDGLTRVRGFLGAERNVALRWQSRAAEIARKAVLTCETTAAVQVTPTVVKYNTALRYEILQGSAPRLVLTLPAAQALTKLQGDGVRDWQIKPEGGQQTLTVEFIKPIEKSYALTLLSEQTLDNAAATAPIVPPQPADVERESGSLTLAAEDVLVETDAANGLRQVNASAGAIAAYQFYTRPFTLSVKLRRIEPVMNASDRVTVRLEESRLLVAHALTLNVEKAGIYAVELVPQTGFIIADVRGDGIEDWKATAGKLTLTFNTRVLGSRRIDVQLEQALKVLPEKIDMQALRVTGAVRETAQIGAVGAAGIQLKTAANALTNVREISVSRLATRTDETLAYDAQQADWRLTLTVERLTPRITADIFNLVTIGDGLLGGSATIRYAIINQGVQEFHVKVPGRWKNVEFTGPNIRRKEQQDDVWVIGLQEKVWGGYTLVVTYDYQFDPHQASLALGGIHCENVERETGNIAITSAANLQIEETKATGAAASNATAIATTIYRLDETELAGNDRALITRPVLMAYRYAGRDYDLGLAVTRFEELPVLDAVADRTQMTTVLTEAGQMLTQASFMVKNNDRQFQTFTLPEGADLWSCFVGNQAVKPERTGNKLLVPLPRRANRDEAFAVDIVYKQKIASLGGSLPRRLALRAPVTDLQTTYAEWELYVPTTERLLSFGGNMTVARGTTYGLRDAWLAFTRFYDMLYRNATPYLFGFIVCLILGAVVITAIRRGGRAVLTLLVLVVLVAILAGMMLPALSSARGKARRTQSMNNLKQIGLGIAQFSADRAGAMPGALDEILGTVGSDKVFVDVDTGERFTYIGAGRKWQEGGGDEVVAYSTRDMNGRNVLFSDGHVEWVMPDRFGELLSRTVTSSESAKPGQGAAVSSWFATDIRGDKAPTAAAPPTIVAGTGQIVPHGDAFNSLIISNGGRFAGANGTTAPGNALTFDGGVAGGANFSHGFSGGDATVAPTTSGKLGVSALVAGIRPIRIDLPKTGQRFVFTKVLNVSAESLAVQAVAMEQATFKLIRGSLQTTAFVLGLAFVWWQWRREQPKSWWLALGLALAVGAIVSLLVTYRLLHIAMILAVPIIGFVVLVWLVRKFWKSRAAKQPVVVPPPMPPAVAGIVLALLLSGMTVQAKDDAAVSILSANYTGTVRALDTREANRAGQFEVVIALTSAKDNQQIRLFGNEVAVQEFTASPATVKLVREGQSISVFIPRKGPATLKLKFLTKTAGDVARRQVVFNIPAALVSKVNVTLDEPDAQVEAPTAVSFKSTPAGQQTTVEAVLGAAERVELNWTPRMKRAADVTTTVFCSNAALVTFGSGLVNVRAVLDYQVTQGELRQMRVALPAGQRLMRVEGESIRTWKLDGQTLNVELVKGVTPSYRLTVETELLQSATPATVDVETPHALDVKRETGVLALKAADELSVSVARQQDLQKVDVEEFTRICAAGAGTVTSAFRFLKTDFKLAVRVEPVLPHLEAVVRNHARVTTEQINLLVIVDYTIKRAGIFALRLALPADYRVEKVNGAKIAQWVEKDGKLDVTLKERTTGAYNLSVELTKTLKELPKTLEITGAQPLEVQKLTGFVSVSSEEGVQIKTETFDGITEVPATLIGGSSTGGSVLGFKLVGGDNPTWKLAVSTEKIESWVRAEVMNTVTLSETLVSGRSVVRYDVANAPTKEFRVRVPAALRNVEINGANIRRKDHDEMTGEWRVELQNKVRGTFELAVTWDMPWDVKTASLEVLGVEAPGVERETGWVAIVAPSRLRVEKKSATNDMLPVDGRDLPEWAARMAEMPVLAYRYLRPGFRLALTTQRFDEAEVLQALVDNVRLTTVVSEDGQMMTEMSLAMRNNARQYLEITLPPGTTNVWSAFVAGQPVRPTVRANKVLLPMERSSGDATVAVELTFVGANPFPQRRGAVTVTAPALDVPLKNARWDFYLPPDYSYGDFAGTMKREFGGMPTYESVSGTAIESTARSYSYGDYQAEEGRKQAVEEYEMKSLVSNAKSQLAEGNLSGANSYWNMAQRRNRANDNDELKKLSKDIQQKQALNYVQAQQQFLFDNGGQVINTPAQYDAKAAEQQVAKVQAAQEISVAKALPLRVNLPKRGVYVAFSQVLQTEVGKPMDVQFHAVNDRATGWPSRVVMGAAGFVALWGFVAVVLMRRRSE